MLTTYFYNNRQLLILSIVVTLVAGTSAFNALPRLEDPRISNRNPLIITTLPGANAERVEALVTKKIETELRDLSEIKIIESESRSNISFIQLELDDAVYDTEAVFTKIRDKIADIRSELPPESTFPNVDDDRGAVAFTLILGVRWNGSNREAELNLLNRTAEELADRMRNIVGTDLVRIYGEPTEEITVELARDSAAELGLTPRSISQRVQQADSKVAAGTIRSDTTDMIIEVEGAFESIDRIRNIPVIAGNQGEVVRLADVAKVRKKWLDPPNEIAFANQQRSIFVAVRMLDDQKVSSWMKSVQQTLNEFNSLTSKHIQIEPVFEQQKYTQQRLGDLGLNLLMGAFVVVAVIFFIMGWRNAILVGTTLPLVSALVLFGLQWLEIPLHQMSIFGLIVAIGLLIDNAIVVVDEVTKEMRKGQAPFEAIDRTVRQLFIPLLGSTVTTVLSFLPIFLLPGNVGEFVGSIATTVILSLVFSFLVSMTIIPALAGIFANSAKSGQWWNDGIESKWFADKAQQVLRYLVKRPVLGIALAASVPMVGFLRVTDLKNQFFPGADRNQFQVQVWTSPQSSIKSTARTSQAIDQVVRQYEQVQRVDWLVGASMPTVYYNLVMTQDNNPSYAQAIVTTRTAQESLKLIPKLQDELNTKFPDTQVVARQLSQGPPVIAPIEIRIYGPSIRQLKKLGQQVRKLLSQTPGVVHTRSTFDVSRSKVMIRPKESEAELAGLSLNEIADQLQMTLEGAQGGILLESTEQLPVRIRYGNKYRGRLNEIASSRIRVGGDSPWMPLESVAGLEILPEESSIPRRNGERCNTIQAFVVASALPPEVTDQFLAKFESGNITVPAGYRIQVGGDSEELGNSMANLLAYAPLLAVLIFATLILSFRSFILALIIGMVAGLSAGIAFFTIWVSGYPLGFNPLIGMAGLVGLAINDSIVVLTQIRSNVDARKGNRNAIVAEVLNSGRHVIATTLTTIGGFLPLLLGGGTFWPPLAIVIAGGVGGATILATLFVPCLYGLLQPFVEKPELTSKIYKKDHFDTHLELAGNLS